VDGGEATGGSADGGDASGLRVERGGVDFGGGGGVEGAGGATAWTQLFAHADSGATVVNKSGVSVLQAVVTADMPISTGCPLGSDATSGPPLSPWQEAVS
jgi:hypothetical protein